MLYFYTGAYKAIGIDDSPLEQMTPCITVGFSPHTGALSVNDSPRTNY